MNSENNTTLLGCMSKLPDPREPYNQKHKFLDIVTITVLAILCGADTWDEVSDWGIANEDWLSTFLELENGIPSHDTFNRVFQMIDSKKFHELFIEWTESIVEKVEGVKPGMVVEVLQKGYLLKDKVIRPAMVKVSE